MRIYKITNPSGKTMYGIDYKDASDKRIQKIISSSKKDAEDALAKARTDTFNEKTMGIKTIPKKYFSELREKFESYSKTNKKANTHASHLYSLLHLRKVFDNEYLEDITVLKIEEYKAKRSECVKPASLNRELACIKYMFNLAEEWGFIKTNIAKKIKMVKEPSGRVQYLKTKDDIQKLISSCVPGHLRMAVIIALNTGMRRGEILSLTKDRIDLENKLIRVFESKSGKPRDVPINKILHKALREWMEKIDGNELFAVKEIKRSFNTACRKAGIKNFTFHDLRHTFASHLVMDGVDIATVSRLLGHANIQMTMKYAHLSPDHRLLAVQRMERFFDGI